MHETDSPNHRIARFGFFEFQGLEKLPDEEEVDEVSFRCCLLWGMTAGEVFQFEPEKKDLLTFHYAGWLIGILIVCYYDPYING